MFKPVTAHKAKTIVGIICIIIITSFIAEGDTNKDEYSVKRAKMVHYQLKLRDIRDKTVLDVMERVPRHLFVPKNMEKYAYDDRPLAIGYGQTISQPYIVAYMTEVLSLTDNSVVLEIGTGSGYQAAILAEIVKEVYTIEIVEPLYKKSTELFKELGYKNIQTKYGDGYFGWEEKEPFDAIIVTCAAEFVPPPLVRQLKVGGLICIPVGPLFGIQNLLLVRKRSEDQIETEIICQVRFVPLTRKK